MHKNFSILGYLLLVTCFSAHAQNEPITISGKILDNQKKPVLFASVLLEESGKGTVTNEKGLFQLNNIHFLPQTLRIECIGYKDYIIQLKKLDDKEFIVMLEPAQHDLEEVVVRGKSKSFLTREKAFTVSAIDFGDLQNSNLDVSHVLNRTTGVKIREEGGLGSNFKFSINGLSGRQVKFFMDGIPMDYFGTSYNINNIPVNLVERIEVYKGVVPVWLGNDALGGAVNIITRENMKNYLDASYTIGSFNTHKASINGKYLVGKQGIVTRVAAYFNYSDNNYRVDDIEKHDALGNVVDTISAKRFHDAYRSGMIQFKTGLENKKFADKISLGLVLSGSKNNIQHGLSLERVFGQVHRRDNIIMPSLEYQKNNLFIKGLSIASYASYIDGYHEIVDTSSREYSWDGSYKIRNNVNIGESDWQKSLFSFNDKTLLSVNNISYKKSKNELDFNHTYTSFTRVGEDPYDPDIVPFSDPNQITKNIFGFSYTRHFFDKKFSVSSFIKYFLYDGKTIEEDRFSEGPNKIVHENTFHAPGYGFASTFHMIKGLQFKGSFENTFRLPDGSEIFGDGLNIKSNPLLAPEHSNNLNAGILFHQALGHHDWIMESNFFYRLPVNLIRVESTGAKSRYENLSKASMQGLEVEVSYRWRDMIFATLNATYQDLVNHTQYDEHGNPNATYLDKLPNIPYCFGNLHFAFQKEKLANMKGKAGVHWHTNYVNKFFLQWPGHGSIKPTIPTQWAHSLEMSYSTSEDRYHFSIGSSNIFNTKMYDNYRIQKPGRAFYLKIRYFIN